VLCATRAACAVAMVNLAKIVLEIDLEARRMINAAFAMAMICHVQIARVSQMEVLAWIRAVNVVVTAHLALREVAAIIV